jgi:beta-glucosidase
LGPHVRDFIPQNEPNAWALGVLVKYFPLSGRQSYRRYLRTLDVEAEAFCDAARIIREVRPDARIIAVEAIIHWEPDAFDWFNFWYNKALEYNYYHLDKIGDACDWIGINYYFREIATPRARRLQAKRTGENVSDMGWMIDAQGLEAEIAGLAARYRKPILVTENGIPDRTDIKRRRYLVDHVAAVRRAIKAGYDVRGYFHWTLVDNYEWADGYKQKFGLFSMDPQTRALIPKPSARVYRDLIAGTASNAPLEPIPATGVAPLLSAASMPTGGE